MKLACNLVQVLQLFVSETRKNWSQEYLVCVSRGAPIILPISVIVDHYKRKDYQNYFENKLVRFVVNQKILPQVGYQCYVSLNFHFHPLGCYGITSTR